MDNGKTKTASFFRPSFVTLIEPFKYVFQIFFLNSHSIIRQQQLHAVFLLRQGNFDFVCMAVSDYILNEIIDNPHEKELVVIEATAEGIKKARETEVPE